MFELNKTYNHRKTPYLVLFVYNAGQSAIVRNLQNLNEFPAAYSEEWQLSIPPIRLIMAENGRTDRFELFDLESYNSCGRRSIMNININLDQYNQVKGIWLHSRYPIELSANTQAAIHWIADAEL